MIVLLLLLTMPNPRITSGVIRPLTQSQICSIRWGLDRRHVTVKMKRSVFLAYKIPWMERVNYEVDHLIPRELGGADDVKNLWPQLWVDAHKKDRRENELHKLVCAGKVPLVEAQEEMKNWR